MNENIKRINRKVSVSIGWYSVVKYGVASSSSPNHQHVGGEDKDN